ncbi:MAG TPA: SRPBCC family protein, partial [Gemmatimonadales bacterium]|nr:SRPBCC family protein [Gemmatimonadales bacterium]
AVSQPTTASRSIEIAASPEAVYDTISDVTRTGEWSPECHTCVWLGEPGQVGSRFKGSNKSGPLRWSTTAEVTAADRGREFAFATVFRGRPVTQWTYTMSASDGGTTLTESFESVSTPLAIRIAEVLVLRNRQAQLERGLEQTLARIKAIVEARP